MGASRLVPGFEPETDLERALAEDPALLRGLAWGTPRPGHPEGAVGAHVADLLRRVEASGATGRRRSELRLLALVHDSMKHDVDPHRPRTGENHHAQRARRLLERYTDDERLLGIVELHDRPYALWRRVRRTGRADRRALEAMLARVPDLDLFAAFVGLDSSTAGKDPAPLAWLRDELRRRSPAGSRSA